MLQSSTRAMVSLACLFLAFPQLLAVSLQGQSSRKHLRLLRGNNTRVGTTLTNEFPYYHSTSELKEELRRLQGDCRRPMALRTISDSGVDIDVVSLNAGSAKKPIFMMAGEHARELIGPESLLYMLQTLCGQTELTTERQSMDVLDGIGFELILNANPRSRQDVEAGSYCQRNNPNDVDLNRNWGGEGLGLYAGDHPFSEPETRAVRAFLEESPPTAYISIHSGTKGVYMPWAYDREHMATRNQQAMLEILRTVDEKHCQCPFGAAGKEVGYSCPGTSVDWVYSQLNASYSFAYEIWVGQDRLRDLKNRWQELRSVQLMQNEIHLGHDHFRSLFEHHPSDFVRNGSDAREAVLLSPTAASEHADACFLAYNPGSEDLYKWAVSNWAAAYLDTSELIAARM